MIKAHLKAIQKMAEYLQSQDFEADQKMQDNILTALTNLASAKAVVKYFEGEIKSIEPVIDDEKTPEVTETKATDELVVTIKENE